MSERDRALSDRYFVVWEVKTEGVILPEERLPTGPTILVGLQHVVAMFGATVLAPLLMGFDPNVSVLFSASERLSSLSWSAGGCRAIWARASPSSRS